MAVLGALYVHFGGLSWMTAIFYGVSPAVIALILHSCWRLAKLGMEDKVQWAIAAVCFFITVMLQAEVAILFIGAGVIGILFYGSLLRGGRPPAAMMAVAAPITIGSAPQIANSSLLGKLFLFFLKAGSLTFGSGLVIVPFLEKGLVQDTAWLNPREFLVAVAIGMLSPGPVVITATFVGYLVAGGWLLGVGRGDGRHIPAVLSPDSDCRARFAPVSQQFERTGLPRSERSSGRPFFSARSRSATG